MCSRLQPYVTQGATLCAPGCNPVPPGLQPYVTQAFELMQRENDQLRRRLHELEASGWYGWACTNDTWTWTCTLY